MKADWLEAAEAANRIVDSVEPLDAEQVRITEALGRVLAEDLIAPIDIPRWTNSAMDGFAVRAADVAGASHERPVTLPVVDDVPAGGFPQGPLPEGSAIRVMTGAPVPEGADSVIRVEHTDGGSEIGSAAGRVVILDDQDGGKNLRLAGEDLRRGTVALARGIPLSAGAIGVAASIGFETLSVHRRPIVALLTSGDELVELDRFDEVLAGRKIVSSNSYTLSAQLRAAGCEVRYLGIAADDPESLRAAVERAAGADALVTSAGISVGEHDYIKRVLENLDTRFDFWRVRIRPGSPMAFGEIGGLRGIPWFGLPGNPVSSMVTFEVFVRPALLRMSGRKEVFPVPIRATLAEDVRTQEGLTHFIRVRIESSSEGWLARTTGPQGSGILRSLAEADGLMIVPRGTAEVLAGESVHVIPLEASPRLLSARPAF